MKTPQNEPPSGLPLASCSALQRAMDDGQEIKMHRFWNPSEQRNEYLVRISGDCYIESKRSELADAITDAAKLYKEWFDGLE
jgi:hypothetical protein